jgi:DNA modification methylase
VSFTIHQGDALKLLRTLPEASVHSCITSPPYWKQRDYGVDGQLGQEADPVEFVNKLADVFDLVRPVLRDDGTLWVNIADTYAAGGNGGGGSLMKSRGSGAWGPRANLKGWRSAPPGMKAKDMVGIPWMLAFELRRRGWFWRQVCIWHKPNCFTEAAPDRPTRDFEPVLLFAKSKRYFWDKRAAIEPIQQDSLRRSKRNHAQQEKRAAELWPTKGKPKAVLTNPDGRNMRTVWEIAVGQSSDGHHATFPIELPEKCMRVSVPTGGTVLDPFAGAGTTGLACLKNGRNFVGIELKPEYIEIANKRARKYYPLLMGAAG